MIETRSAILSYAESRKSFRFNDLLCYLNSLLDISKVALSWHLRKMVGDNSLFKLGRGIYTLHNTQTQKYTPRLATKTIKVCKDLTTAFPFLTISVFDGNVLADFQHHMSLNNSHYIEVERDAMESVFHYLQKQGYVAYLNPDKDFVYTYISISDEAFIVKPLISESPLIDFKGVKTPSLEKILVDILCDSDMDHLHGSEWYRIFDNAHTMYAINRTAMLRYASRRNAKQTIENAIEKLGANYD